MVAESEGFNFDKTIYPDNWLAVLVFKDMLTQWRYGPAGISGLDYGPLSFVMKTRGVRFLEREDVFESIQIMERAALAKVKSS